MTTCKTDCTHYSQCVDNPNVSNFKYYHLSTVVHLSCLGFTQKNPAKLCEACDKNKEMWHLQDVYGEGTPPYKVCANCLTPLTAYSLSPKQFKNLLKNGHTVSEFLLHEDFYDDEGKALQPFL